MHSEFCLLTSNIITSQIEINNYARDDSGQKIKKLLTTVKKTLTTTFELLKQRNNT